MFGSATISPSGCSRKCLSLISLVSLPLLIFSLLIDSLVSLLGLSHRIVVTSNDCGFVETVPNAISIHSLKKRFLLADGTQRSPTLMEHFVKTFGEKDTPAFDQGLANFVASLAGYSLITYFLQLRDR